MLARIRSAAVLGIDAYLVDVEVDITNGLPSVATVGLPHGAVKEGRERVNAALLNAGFVFPLKRITINLAPADVRKDGSGFDLPIALGILAASTQVDGSRARGSPRPRRGRARGRPAAGPRRPLDDDRRAEGRASGRPAARRQCAGGRRRGRDRGARRPHALRGLRASRRRPGARADAGGCPRPDGGAPCRCRGLLGCARAGRRQARPRGGGGGGAQHSAGRSAWGREDHARPAAPDDPPGDGARRGARNHQGAQRRGIAGTRAVAVRFAAVSRSPSHYQRRRPHRRRLHARVPARSAWRTAACLFLDELPEFRTNVLEVLRQPLEDGHVTLSRAAISLSYPARFMLAAAMNPCPCGYLGDPSHRCHCAPMLVERYLSRLSGPLLDRIDIHLEVPAVAYRDLAAGAAEESERGGAGPGGGGAPPPAGAVPGHAGALCQCAHDRARNPAILPTLGAGGTPAPQRGRAAGAVGAGLPPGAQDRPDDRRPGRRGGAGGAARGGGDPVPDARPPAGRACRPHPAASLPPGPATR